MSHPLFDFARRVELHRAQKRQRHALDDALTNPHLAQDLGLPPRTRPRVKSDLW